MDALNLGPASIVGWSDGGIIALLMGVQNRSIKRIVSMAANLRPDTSALHPFFISYVDSMYPQINLKLTSGDPTMPWEMMKQHGILMKYQPNISKSDLSKITTPTLVISGDDDIIRLEHTLEIFEALPNAQLCILPGDTHFSPASNAFEFNRTVHRFISEPFQRPTSNWTEWK